MRYLVCTGRHDPIPNVNVRECGDESQLLFVFRTLVIEEDPDFFVAYNGVNFDNRFMAVRAQLLGMHEFFYMSRYALRPSRLRELQLRSSGMGDNLLRYFDLPGRNNLDWYVKLKRDLTQEDSYSLDYMAKKFCDSKKVELASGLKWKWLSDNVECDPEYEIRTGTLADRLADGAALYTPTQQEWQALAVMEELCEKHWVRSGTARYCPANTKHRAIRDLYYGTARDRARLGYYCVEDSELLDRLDEARTMIIQILQFAGIFGIVTEWVYFRGQQVRFVSQLLQKVRVVEAVPLLLQRPRRDRWEDRFEGATVNDPVRGFQGRPVAVLDWKSLYPAIMMSNNLCHSTWVKDPSLFDSEGVVRYDISPTYVTRFVTQSVHRGILPLMLEELGEERNRAKAMMKKYLKLAATSEDGRRYALLGWPCVGRTSVGRQGVDELHLRRVRHLGGGGCRFPCQAISATVTYMGRTAMVVKKELLPRHFPGIEVIYGDSVAAYTPLLLRYHGTHIRVLTMDDLWSEAVPTVSSVADKETAILPSNVWETWTETGWTAITTVVRHACAKRMVRVTTHTGTVDVTEDHSLVRQDGTACTANDVVVGVTRLLHSFPMEHPDSGDGSVTVELARILGFLVGNGTLKHANRALLETYRRQCEVVFQQPFQILGPSAGVYRLVPVGNVTFRDLCYDGKTIPQCILNASFEIMTSFVDGLFDAATGGGGRSRLWQAGGDVEQTSERVCLGLYYILRRVGYNVSVHTHQDKLHMYRIRFTKEPLRWDGATVESLFPFQTVETAYVYDLTTNNHHFHAGVGSMIVHNTDSVMVVFPNCDDVQTCGRLGAEAATLVTDHFVHVLQLSKMELEFEKCYHPYLLQGKKRYVGHKFEPDADGVMHSKGIDAKGVETERKDTLPYVKEIFFSVRDALMFPPYDEVEALRRFRVKTDALVDDRVPMEMLTLRKNLSSKVEGKTDTIVQARVNAKRREREPGSEAAINEQVEYVILNGYKGTNTTFLAEDPVYAREENLRLNRLWYFEHCIRDAMKKVFDATSMVDEYARACVHYRDSLNAVRLNVNRNALQAMFVTGDAASSSSVRRVSIPDAPRPPPPVRRRKR